MPALRRLQGQGGNPLRQTFNQNDVTARTLGFDRRHQRLIAIDPIIIFTKATGRGVTFDIEIQPHTLLLAAFMIVHTDQHGDHQITNMHTIA